MILNVEEFLSLLVLQQKEIEIFKAAQFDAAFEAVRIVNSGHFFMPYKFRYIHENGNKPSTTCYSTFNRMAMANAIKT